jgi:ABC-type glycerol-3-phosphate transport system substrate-binding protein
MGRDKSSMAREWILDLLESGRFDVGDRLPGAREIAYETGMSLLTAQAAIKTLERDGVLELHPRTGAFVKADWRKVPLESRLFHFSPSLPWMPRFAKIIQRRMPAVKLAKAFECGIFEMRTTTDLLSHRVDYKDVSGFFKEAYPDQSPFYEKPFQGFRQDGRLLGVPFIFSPRAIVYNPAIFKGRGCPEPHSAWTWDEFIGSIRALKAAGQPKDEIFSLEFHAVEWMNFVLRTGGSLFDPSAADPVRIDSPETRKGLRLYKQIQMELGVDRSHGSANTGEAMINGKLAMTLIPRELRAYLKAASFDSWKAVPLPSVPGGMDANTQATDLLCVRRECKDSDLAVELIRFLLSEEVQDFIGAEKYGIPIRKSSALKSLDPDSPRDKVFFDQIDFMRVDYNLDSADILCMINEGIGSIWRDDADINATTSEIASALRTYLKIRKYGEMRR